MKLADINLSKVKIQSDGAITRLAIDGVDVSSKVSEAGFSIKAGECSTLTVKMFIDGADIQSVTQVVCAEKSGESVKVILDGDPKEIAALVLAAQERRLG